MARAPRKPKAAAAPPKGLVANLKDLQVGPIERPAGSLMKKPKPAKGER